ncbi:MAG TPA: pseudouridine synthase [Bacteroidia bacterium]|nr:pseudouridine synthase [Bacteroidia bacterium]
MDKRNSSSRSKFGAKKSSFKKDSSDKPKRNFADKGERAPYSDRPKRSFDKDSSDKPKRSFDREGGDKPKRNFADKGERTGYADRPKRSFDKESTDRPKRSFDREGGDKPKRNFSDKGGRSSFGDKSKRSFSDRPKRSFDKEEGAEEGKSKKLFADRGERAQHYANKNEKSQLKRSSFERGERAPYDPSKPKNYKKDYTKKKEATVTNADKGLIRLNKYIANAGICSRREADDLIKSGCVTVNGKVISELGYTVKATDEINYSGERIKSEKHVYLLLNKPKDYITTNADERGRKTVMELIDGACKERIYPVGRLDRNTTGLLLFTNDGDLTKKLTHPKHEVEKLYHVELDKNFKQDDFVKLKEGVELEDGFIKPDEVAYTGETKREVGVKIHSGRNRIVRRTFEFLGYDVLRLDRVMFASLTKKNLPRAKWRFLTDKEVSFLKMLK